MSVTDELKGMTEIALFAGAGGGVLGSKMLGIRTVAYVEWDAYPQAILKARMADGLIETAPVFGDVREFDTTPYAGKVEVVSGGFPCQPFSTAGRQEADFDPRNMWPATRDIIRGVRPKYAYLENVAGLLTGTHGYFGVVIGELARSGYDVAWTCLPAAAVGAPHRRDRMWILGRRRDVDSAGTVPLAEFARFDQGSLSWRSGSGRCRGDTASTVTASVPWPRSGFVRTDAAGSVVAYALDPVSLSDGTTRDGWPWPRILEDLRIPDPLAGARPAAPDSPGIEMLPTPNAFDAHAVGASRAARRPEWGRHGVSLHHLAADWSAREGSTYPTPQAASVTNDVTVRSASKRSANAPPNKLGWAVGEAEDTAVGGRMYPTPLAGNATPGEGGNHGGMALRAVAALEDMRGIEHDRTWVTPTAGISKEVVTPGMADRADRNRHPGNLLEDVAQSLYGEGADPPDTAWPEGRKTWPTPTVRDMKGASQSFVQKGLETGHYSGLDGAVVGAAIEEADGDGWSPLGRFIQNNNVRPPRRTKEEREAARAARGPVGQLNPDWVEWLMGWPVGWTSMSPMSEAEAQAYAENMPGSWWRREPPHIPRITVGTPDRAARLKACGNGQVSLCAAAAFEVLLETYRQIDVACVTAPEMDAFDLLGL